MGSVQVKVVSMASGAAEQALARGWDEKVDGPAPDVWSPASSAWVGLLRQRLRGDSAPLVPAAVVWLWAPLVEVVAVPITVSCVWLAAPPAGSTLTSRVDATPT